MDELTRLQEMPEGSLERPSAFDLAEFQCLREFYKAWEALHAIPNDKWKKKEKEEAARALVEKAHVLRAMSSDRRVVLVPRFTQ